MTMDFDRKDRELWATTTIGLATLKEQAAARKAQDAYNKKKLELERQGLGLQADQIAKQYAMQMAQLEWEKESFRQQFGETQKQNEWERGFRDRELALENQWKTAEQTGFRDGMPTLENLKFQETQRQFNVGQGNNERDFGESVRRYDQDFQEARRKTNLEAVMNAPRGPADWAAYTNRLRGLQQSGALPGAIGSMFDGNAGRVASFSNDGQFQGRVLSNTDMALAMTGQGDPSALQGTPWQGMSPQQQYEAGRTMLHGGQQEQYGQKRSVRPVFQPNQPVGTGQQSVMAGARQFMIENPGSTMDQAVQWLTTAATPEQKAGMLQREQATMAQQGQNASAMASAQQQQQMSMRPVFTPQPPVQGQGYTTELYSRDRAAMRQQGQPQRHPVQQFAQDGMAGQARDRWAQPSVQTGSSNPYSETGAPSGTADSAARMLGTSSTQSGPSNMALPSAQKFRRYAPTEQAMGLGYLSENGGPTEDDAKYLMERQSPNFARSRSARYAGM